MYQLKKIPDRDNDKRYRCAIFSDLRLPQTEEDRIIIQEKGAERDESFGIECADTCDFPSKMTPKIFSTVVNTVLLQEETNAGPWNCDVSQPQASLVYSAAHKPKGENLPQPMMSVKESCASIPVDERIPFHIKEDGPENSIRTDPCPGGTLREDEVRLRARKILTDVLPRKNSFSERSMTNPRTDPISSLRGLNDYNNERSPLNISPMSNAGREIMRSNSKQGRKDTNYTVSRNQAYGWIAKEQDLNLLVDLFREADVDDSGEIDIQEFKSFMKKEMTQRIFANRFGIQPHQCEVVFKAIDVDGSGIIDIEEWSEFCIEKMQDMDNDARGGEFLCFYRDQKRVEKEKKKYLAGRPLKKWKPLKPVRQFKSVSKPIDPNKTINTSTWFFKLGPLILPCAGSVLTDERTPS